MIRTNHSNFPVAALTHPGMSGKNNEDRYAVSAYRLNKRNRAPVLLAVLTDGIGGHRAGEVASEIAVERISQAVAASDGRTPTETLRQAITQASQEIYTLATADLSRQGMGTTCVCAWIIGDRLYTAAIGDSRLYLIRRGSIHQLSTDHTWIQEALEKGVIKPEQAKNHPNQHIIRRYIGSPTPPVVDFRLHSLHGDGTASEENQGMLLREGDRLVLCSDGLTDLVSDREILSNVQKKPLDQASQGLVDLANQRGGHDNITVIAVEVPRKTLFERAATSNQFFAFAAVAAVLLAVLIFTGLVFGFGWLNNRQDVTSTPSGATLQPTQGLPVVLPSETLPIQLETAVAPETPVLLPTATSLPSATVTLPAASRYTSTPWPTNTVQPYPYPYP